MVSRIIHVPGRTTTSFCDVSKAGHKSVRFRIQMRPITEKKDAYEKAKNLLMKNDEALLPYVALELRRCLEAVTYEKLWAYKDRLPQNVARRWQPPQAFKALLLMEPDAATTSTFRYAEESQIGLPASGPFRMLGIDRRPTTGWLTKTFNILGSFLHATWPFSSKTSVKEQIEVRRYLEQVASELEPFVEKSFTSSIAPTLVFRCSVCRTEIRVNSLGVTEYNEVECLNPGCGCHFFVEKDGDQIRFRLDACSLDCPECKKTIEIPTQSLRIGYEFKCPVCRTLFEVFDRTWQVRKKGDSIDEA